MAMRLMRCAAEWLAEADRFGKATFGAEARTDSPVRFRAPVQAEQLASGQVELKQFDGVIEEIDNPFGEDMAYLLVVDHEGVRREFCSAGDLSCYRVGCRLVARYLSIPRTVGGDEQLVFELWLQENLDVAPRAR